MGLFEGLGTAPIWSADAPDPPIVWRPWPLIMSPSQLETWRQCHRKWGWTYLAGIRGTGTKATALGTAVHAQLEGAFTPPTAAGAAPGFAALDLTTEAGEIAAAGLSALPAPGTAGITAEGAFSFPDPWHPDVLSWRGFKDLRHVTADGQVTVYDHKTTSNLKWAKTAADLSKDPQAVIYAMDEFLKNPALTTISLQWTYLRTRRPYVVHPVRQNLTRQVANEQFQIFSDQALACGKIAASVTEVRELDHNPAACEAFGGCPFVPLCRLTPSERLISISRKNPQVSNGGTMSNTPVNPLLAGLAAPVSAPSQAPIPTAQGGADSYKINGHPVPFEVWQMFVDKQHADGPRPAAPAPNQVNPPEFQPPPVAAPVAAPDQAPRKRGRPPGSKNKATLEREAAQAGQNLAAVSENIALAATMTATSAAPAPGLAPMIQLPVPQASSGIVSGGGITPPATGPGRLFINVTPPADMTGCADAARLFAAANKAVCNIENAPPVAPDWRPISDYRQVQYGAGPGALATQVAALWTEGDLYIDLRTHEGAACAMTLAARASRVIWGS